MSTLTTMATPETSMPTENPVLSDEECLMERKWWCFLLSSIFTFLVGLITVASVRAIASMCCKKEEEDFSAAEIRRQEEEAKRRQGSGEGGGPEGDFMSEAKDWAGELISGQTGTGRILVRFLLTSIFSSASSLVQAMPVHPAQPIMFVLYWGASPEIIGAARLYSIQANWRCRDGKSVVLQVLQNPV